MAEQNYGSRKSAVSSEAGVHKQHTRQQSAPRSRGQAQVRESSGQRLKRSARLPVTGGGVWNDARQRLRTLKQDTDDYVQKNPTKAVFTALGIGFVLALMRRR